jgi:polyisoprenoid-binding protein YceI
MLRTLLFTLALTLGFTAHGETLKVNSEQSKVHWKGTKIGGAHDGTVGVQSGSLTFKDGALTAVEVLVDMTAMTNNDLSGEWAEKLIGHLKNDDFFSVDKYPTSRIKSKSVEKISDNRYKVVADLTIKDKTQAVTFEAELNRTGKEVKGKTQFTFNRADFDIRYNSGRFFQNLGDKLIHDDVTLTVELSAKK